MKNFLKLLIFILAIPGTNLAQDTHSGTVSGYSTKNILNGGITDSTKFIITNNGRVDLKFCLNSSMNNPCYTGLVVASGQSVTKKAIDLGGVSSGDKLNVTNSTDGTGSYLIVKKMPIDGGPGPAPAPSPDLCIAPGPLGVTNIKGAVWTPLSHPNYGIVYTGVSCPDRVGIGTNDPLGMLHVNGNALFNGNVGIGTTTPVQKLEVNGFGRFGNSNANIDLGYDGAHGIIESNQVLLINYYNGKDVGIGPGLLDASGTFISEHNTFLAASSGKVGIGTSNINCSDCSGYKLFVTEGIRTEKVKVDIAANNGWSDYVFGKDHKLMSLAELEKFIKDNKHLPGIPSTNEVTEKGIDVAEMLSLQMAKIEELTLFIIDLNKKIEKIEKENIALKNRVEEFNK